MLLGEKYDLFNETASATTTLGGFSYEMGIKKTVTVHSVPVTGKNPCKICFANGFLLFKLYGFSRNAQFSAFLTCEQ